MKGKHAIFPFSFHVTGMPIKACADKLKRELEIYGAGGPPRASEEELLALKEEMKADLMAAMAPDSGNKKKKENKKDNKKDDKKDDKQPGSFHSNKSKAVAKTGKAKTQWDIMRSIGIPDEDISKFTDADYWLEYFPPRCKSDLKSVGTGVDWRRSFYTTPANPYYDKFVIWQFLRLKEKNKIDYGNRYSIYSPLDGQPCMDHDRSSGETVLPLEYTLIKLEMVPPYPESLKALEGKKVFLAAATLRPETMYGQTNCWLLPTGEYGAYQINEDEIFIMTEQAARNCSFQGLSLKKSEVTCLAKVMGSDLFGIRLKAPLSANEYVYALPMLTVSMKKGTGVVTSVPSDSPDDLAALRDLKSKPALREKFGIKDEWVLPFEPIPILKNSKGNLAAVTISDELKIQSQNDREKLAKAKEQCYKIGFYESTLLVGDYAGSTVIEAKDKIRNVLIEKNEAVKYAEPENEVISRSGDVCVVALTEQWFFTYGEEEWRAKAESALERLNTFSDETRHQFQHTLDWLKQWACSRTYGLGSRLPWDKQFLIESLSDSTIYMALYTISHLLQGGAFDGSQTGPSGITPEQLTPEVFDYIFLKKDYPENCSISEDTLSELRREFEYWYPFDLRVSGKDLVPNHLTFCIYNHVAIWDNDESKWPLGIRANGHLLLNKQKMSKNTGNFLTLTDSCALFGADATRIALAHAGDSITDANFSSDNANKAVLDLYNGYQWAKEILEGDTLKERDMSDPVDRTFDSAMNKLIKQTDEAYSNLLFREGLVHCLYELRSARDAYRLRIGPDNMNRSLIERFIEVQALMMVPIAPHWAEQIWTLLGREGFIVHAPFPEPGEIDELLLRQESYITKIREDFGKKITSTKSRKEVNTGLIYVADSYPEWHEATINLVQDLYSKNNGVIDTKKALGMLKSNPIIKKQMKLAVPLVKSIAVNVETEGESALELRPPFDEKKFLTENLPFLERTLEIPFKVLDEDGSQRVAAVPMNPTLYFE